jgi:hypothetical protein
MFPSSSHAKVETLTVALAEVTSAAADGILASMLKVLRDQSVCVPRLHRFWILKCLAVPCVFCVLPCHHNTVLCALSSFERRIPPSRRFCIAPPPLPRTVFGFCIAKTLPPPPPPTHTHFCPTNPAHPQLFGAGKNN